MVLEKYERKYKGNKIENKFKVNKGYLGSDFENCFFILKDKKNVGYENFVLFVVFSMLDKKKATR